MQDFVLIETAACLSTFSYIWNLGSILLLRWYSAKYHDYFATWRLDYLNSGLIGLNIFFIEVLLIST